MMTSNYTLSASFEGRSSEALWANCIEGLHQRYYQLGDSIMWLRREQDNSLSPLAALRESKSIGELCLLQEEVMFVLGELLMNMDMPEGDVSMALPVKQQLQHHARVLQQTNHRVDAALSRMRMKNPAFDAWMKQDR